ncbi:MAG: single-stranded DNA-binding protein [Mogibacterium sp.]|nr:single-stranded DNA-binding protein [Mogibacterium sp.]
MNSVILVGRLARDPELRYTPNNTPVTHFTLAIDRPAQQGQERQADFIRITVFGRQAETVERYLKKGRQAAVQGRIQTGSYRNRDGQTVYTTDVIADRVEFLGSGNGGGQGGGYNNSGNGNYGGGQGNYGGGQNGGYNNGDGQSNYRDDARNNEPFGPDEPYAQGGDQDYPEAFQATDDDIPF